MATLVQKIAEIAEWLDPEAQSRLLEVAESMSSASGTFYERMTTEQRAQLERSCQDALEGRIVEMDEVDRQIDELLTGGK